MNLEGFYICLHSLPFVIGGVLRILSTNWPRRTASYVQTPITDGACVHGYSPPSTLFGVDEMARGLVKLRNHFVEEINANNIAQKFSSFAVIPSQVVTRSVKVYLKNAHVIRTLSLITTEVNESVKSDQRAC
jgi:hypothetical protein